MTAPSLLSAVFAYIWPGWQCQWATCGALDCPGLIDTPLQDRIWPSEHVKKDFGAASVPGRMGSSEEMATVVAFLACDDASFISGHGLLADGGYSIA